MEEGVIGKPIWLCERERVEAWSLIVQNVNRYRRPHISTGRHYVIPTRLSVTMCVEIEDKPHEYFKPCGRLPYMDCYAEMGPDIV